MDTNARKFSVRSSRLMCLCVSASPCFILAAAFGQAPVIDSISPSSVVEKPVPQPTLRVEGANLSVQLFSKPTITLTHTALPDVSFSAEANVPFAGDWAEVPSGLNHFNMLQMPLGVYDLTLTRPDDASVTVAGGFSITTQPEPEPGEIEMRIAGRWGGPVHGAHVSEDGQTAYIANGRMFRILDLTDETNPVEISSLYLGGGVSDVKVTDGYAFIALSGTSGGFRVVDVSDPTAPELVWATSGGGMGDTIELWGDYAYVGGAGNSIRVFNISDPLNVVSNGTISGGSVNAFTIHGNYLYAGRSPSHPSSPDAVRIFDLGINPANPPLMGALQAIPGDAFSPRAMTAAGNHLYVTSLLGAGYPATLTTIDLTDPINPVFMSTIDGFIQFGPTNRIATSDGQLYVAEEGVSNGATAGSNVNVKGLWIFDIASDLAQPTLVTTYLHHAHIKATTGAVLGVMDGRVYLWDKAEGFVIMDVTDPMNPQRLGRFHSPAELGPMAKPGGSDLLYVSDAWGGFTVLDVSDSDSPQVVSNYLHQSYDHGFPAHFSIVASVNDIAVEGDRAYLTLHNYGLEAIDISNPVEPVFLNAFRIPQTVTPCSFNHPMCSTFFGLAVRNGLAHIGYDYSDCGSCGGVALLTIDVSDVKNLSQFSLVSDTFLATRVALNGASNAFVIGGSGGGSGPERYFDAIHSGAPAFLKQTDPVWTTDIAWHKDVLYIGRDCTPNAPQCPLGPGLYIRDVADPADPVLLTVVNSGRAVAVDVQNDRAYVRWTGNPFHLYDVSDPANPMLLDNINLGLTNAVATNAVLVDEPNIYVTSGGSNVGFGLQIVDVHGLPSTPTVSGDLNGDGSVGVADLLILLAAWGNCPPRADCPADLNGDGSVGVTDLLILLANWG